MAMWILATAAAFSDVQSVWMPHGSVRASTLPALQPVEQERQSAVVSLQRSLPFFAVPIRYTVRKASTVRPRLGQIRGLKQASEFNLFEGHNLSSDGLLSAVSIPIL